MGLLRLGSLHVSSAFRRNVRQNLRFYVSHRWHGSGVAHKLMNEVLAIVNGLASDRLWLGVWERNDRAVRFYRKFGFVVVGDHAFVLGHDTQRDLVMALEIWGTRCRLTSSCIGP